MNDAERQEILYSRIWNEDPDYGTHARDVKDTVAHRIAPHMRRALPGFKDCEFYVHVVDFGAGDGRFLWEMDRQKLHTGCTGVDLCEPANRPGWMRWERVPMWESKARGHYVISTDALEHLPPEMVDRTLCVIGLAAPHGFLRISLKEDRYGTERGLHLHESVFSSGEWMRRMRVCGITPTSYRVYLELDGSEGALEVWY